MSVPGQELAFDPEYSMLERLYVRTLGAPINGLRIRLAHVMPATAGAYGRILDAGCGSGIFSIELAKAHPEAEVVGIDLDERVVAKAALIAARAGIRNLRFEAADVTALPFAEEFDLVVSIDNLEHVEDDVGAIQRLRAALKPNGRLVVHVPGYYRRWPVWKRTVNFDVPGHVRPGYLLDDLKQKLAQGGFKVETATYTFGFFENLANNISYAITQAERKNKVLYAAVFPFLLALSRISFNSTPGWGAGVLAVARAERT